MVKSIVQWYFKRKEVRMYKNTVGMGDPTRRKKVKMINNMLHVAGDGFYNYEKPIKRTIYRYILLALVLLSCLSWVAYESYLGWDLFQP